METKIIDKEGVKVAAKRIAAIYLPKEEAADKYVAKAIADEEYVKKEDITSYEPLRLKEARKIKVIGEATGETTFDGSKDVDLHLSISEAASVGIATKARQDIEGNTITETYVKKNEIEDKINKAELEKYVLKTNLANATVSTATYAEESGKSWYDGNGNEIASTYVRRNELTTALQEQSKEADSKYLSNAKLSKYAETEYVDGKFATQVQLKEYAKANDIENKYVTKNALNNEIAQIENEMVKVNDLGNVSVRGATYSELATDAINDEAGNKIKDTYATKEEIKELAKTETLEMEYAKKTDITKYIEKTEAETKYVNKEQLNSYITEETADTKYTSKSAMAAYIKKNEAEETFVSKSDITGLATKNEIKETYAQKSEIEALAEKSELEKYAKTEQLSEYEKKSEAESKYLGKTSLNGYVQLIEADNRYIKREEAGDYVRETVLSGYVKRENLNPYITKEEANNTYLKSADLSNYITESRADSKYITEDDMEGYLTEDEASTKYVTQEEVRRFALKSETENYVTKTDLKNATIRSAEIATKAEQDANGHKIDEYYTPKSNFNELEREIEEIESEYAKKNEIKNATVESAKNADKAEKWKTGRLLSLSGDISGSVILDGSSDVTINAELQKEITTPSIVPLSQQAMTSDTAKKADECTGNAATATKLKTARSITLSEDAEGTIEFDGSGDVVIRTSVLKADKAWSDSNGNNIVETYETKTHAEGIYAKKENIFSGQEFTMGIETINGQAYLTLGIGSKKYKIAGEDYE